MEIRGLAAEEAHLDDWQVSLLDRAHEGREAIHVFTRSTLRPGRQQQLGDFQVTLATSVVQGGVPAGAAISLSDDFPWADDNERYLVQRKMETSLMHDIDIRRNSVGQREIFKI